MHGSGSPKEQTPALLLGRARVSKGRRTFFIDMFVDDAISKVGVFAVVFAILGIAALVWSIADPSVVTDGILAAGFVLLALSPCVWAAWRGLRKWHTRRLTR